MILPFNLRMGDVVLKYATAQLLTKIEENGNDHYFFFAPEGFMPEYTLTKHGEIRKRFLYARTRYKEHFYSDY